MTGRALRGLLPAFLLLCAACATLASEAGDDDAVRPNNLAGPFRYLVRPELAINAPYTLRRRFVEHRDATLLPLDGERAALYAVANVGNVTGIYRFIANDGRSFTEQPDPASPVLIATETWQGSSLFSPSVARVGEEIWLAYAGTEGIGIARSVDGINFKNAKEPALSVIGANAWENTPPAAPGLLVLGDSDIRLFFSAGSRIGEAKSEDGNSWSRLALPALEPSSEENFDSVQVGDPELWLATTAEGRRVTRLYYTATNREGSTGIGLAARYGSSGPMQRNPAPALTGPRLPRAPAVLPRSGYTLLFVTQYAGSAADDQYPALAVGLAPATLTLPSALP